MSLPSRPPAVAALRSELTGGNPPAAPTTFRLIPAGRFRAWDGRPAELPDGWLMTDDDGARLVAELAGQQRAGLIDYEHATLHAKRSGTPAPAAGWYRRLEWRPGDGLHAVDVEWTAAAARRIAAREYRYLSPLISYDPDSGRVLRLLGAGLTNDPALDGLNDLAALAALAAPSRLPPQPPLQEPRMSEPLKNILAALGLPADADESAALAAVQALAANVAALSAQVSTPDPARWVPVATLTALQAEHAATQGQLAALAARLRAGEVEQVLAQARAAGKLTPALEGWAKDLGTSNLASLSAWVEQTAAVVTPGATQTGGQAPAGGAGGAERSPKSIAAAALSWQVSQAAAGIQVSTAAAVAHVLKTQGDA